MVQFLASLHKFRYIKLASPALQLSKVKFYKRTDLYIFLLFLIIFDDLITWW